MEITNQNERKYIGLQVKSSQVKSSQEQYLTYNAMHHHAPAPLTERETRISMNESYRCGRPDNNSLSPSNLTSPSYLLSSPLLSILFLGYTLNSLYNKSLILSIPSNLSQQLANTTKKTTL